MYCICIYIYTCIDLYRYVFICPHPHDLPTHVSIAIKKDTQDTCELYHRNRCMVEGSLEVKLPAIWTDEKQSREEAERRERLEERRVRRKKMQMREKVGKSRNTVFFQ